jgi:hypothetical protein
VRRGFGLAGPYLDDFWGHILGGSADGLHLRLLCLFSKTEIRDFHFPDVLRRRQQQVFQLQVAMDDPSAPV